MYRPALKLQRSVFFAVEEHLAKVVVGVDGFVVYYGTFCREDWTDFRIDETAVGLEAQGFVAGLDFLVEFGVDVDRKSVV